MAIADTIGSAQQAIAQGKSLFDQASGIASAIPGASGVLSSATAAASQAAGSVTQAASGLSDAASAAGAASSALGDIGDSAGGYGAVAGAAQALLSDLPPSDATTAAVDLAAIAGGALTGAGIGAAVGSVFETVPVFGTLAHGAAIEIGMCIGASIAFVRDVWPGILHAHLYNPLVDAEKIIGGVTSVVNSLVADVFGSTPDQGDYRYLSEKACFPYADVDYQYGVVPGEMRWVPRLNPQSTFYQLNTGPNSAPSRHYGWTVTWQSPANSTPASKAAAWALGQFYTQVFSRRIGHSLTGAITWAQVVAAFNGNATLAGQALQKVIDWYGPPSHFDPTPPYPTQPGDVGFNVDTGNDTASVDRMMATLVAHPLDYLYYPIWSQYDHGAKQFKPCSHQNETDVMVTPDLSLMTVCEAAVLQYSDLAMFHLAVQLQHYFVLGRRADAKLYAGVGVPRSLMPPANPNLHRIIGYSSAAARRSLPAVGKPGGAASRVRLSPAGKARLSREKNSGIVQASRASLSPSSHGSTLIAAGALGAAGLAYLALRK